MTIMSDASSSGVARHRVAIGLGGNLDEPPVTFARACRMLADAGVEALRMADVIITEPVDCVPGTPDFHNTAVTGYWRGTALELLAVTQGIEVALGRPKSHSSRESRVVDLDILLFDDEVMALPGLIVPHPRMFARQFVLAPLGELAPEWLEAMRAKVMGSNVNKGE